MFGFEVQPGFAEFDDDIVIVRPESGFMQRRFNPVARMGVYGGEIGLQGVDLVGTERIVSLFAKPPFLKQVEQQHDNNDDDPHRQQTDLQFTHAFFSPVQIVL